MSVGSQKGYVACKKILFRQSALVTFGGPGLTLVTTEKQNQKYSSSCTTNVVTATLLQSWGAAVWLCVCSVFLNKDNPEEQTDDAGKSQDAAAAAAVYKNADAISQHQSDRQSQYQSAYGAWQTVQQDV